MLRSRDDSEKISRDNPENIFQGGLNGNLIFIIFLILILLLLGGGDLSQQQSGTEAAS